MSEAPQKAPIVAVGIDPASGDGERAVAVRRADGSVEVLLAHEPETVAEALEDVHRHFCLTELHDPVCRLLREALDGTAQQIMAEDGRKGVGHG
jgi:hypothetical protein